MLGDNNARSMVTLGTVHAVFKFYLIDDSYSFLFPPCRSGEPLLVSWSTLYMVTVIGSGVYNTGTNTLSVGLVTEPSGLLLVNNLLVP